MNKTLLIDNYDSFSFNIVHAFEAVLGHSIRVVKNDQIDFDQIDRFDNFIFSPGPGLPGEAGQMKELIHQIRLDKKILGICLGLQAIAEVFDSNLKQLKNVYHGIQSEIIQTEKSSKLYRNIPSSFKAGRYHSWVIEESSLGPELNITSRDQEGHIMSIEHKTLDIYAVQFHPESIMTPMGNQMIRNFLEH